MDYAKLALLLDVIHKAAAAGPAYAWLVSAAAAEIQTMQPVPTPAPEAPVYPAPVQDDPPADQAVFNRRFAPPTQGDDE